MTTTRAGLVAVSALVLWTVGCGDRGGVRTERDVRETVEEVLPEVERAVGLPFLATPEVAVRSREQMRAYVLSKIETELPPEEIERLTIAYRLFGLIPDTLDLAVLLLELYTEQVVGYYEPDSSTLFMVDDADPAIARLTIAHELVHALQDQYMPLDSILSVKNRNDRVIAAQCVLEGQATLGSMLAIMPGQEVDAFGELWTDAGVRQAMSRQQQSMPVFAAAPRIIREGLVFPYLAGADFVRWFSRHYPDTVPFGPRLPASTEHILRPDRYRIGDMPVDLRFDAAEDAFHTDDLGQFEIQILLTDWTESESVATAGAFGWGGDRYAVFETDGDHALVWWSVWDDERSAERFFTIVRDEWSGRVSNGRTHSVERVDVDGRPGVVFAYYPDGWERGENLPAVSVR